MRKQINYLLFALITLSLILSTNFVSAAVILERPINGTNASTNMLVNCTALLSDMYNITNATIYYNSTGGQARALSGVLTTLVSVAENTTSFQSTVSISSLTDGVNYNLSCSMWNGTGATKTTVNSTGRGVIIDNTACTAGLSFDIDMISVFDEIKIKSSASTDNIDTAVTCNVTVIDLGTRKFISNHSSCDTWTLKTPNTDFPGTYKVFSTCRDNAGNNNTKTKTFDILSSTVSITVPVIEEELKRGVEEQINFRNVIIISAVAFVLIIVAAAWLITSTKKK